MAAASARLAVLLVLGFLITSLSGCLWFVRPVPDGPIEIAAPQGGDGDAFVQATVRFESDTGPVVQGARIGSRPASVDGDSRDLILRTDANGQALFRLQPNTAFHFSAMLEAETPEAKAAPYVDEWGTTQEYILDFGTGSAESTRDILIVLYARHKTIQVDIEWAGPATVEGLPGPFSPQGQVEYQLVDPGFGDPGISDAYAKRISETTVVARWENTMSQYADFGVVLAGGEGRVFHDEHDEMAAAGIVNEQIFLDQGALESAGIRGPGVLEIGVATDQLVVAPEGIRANVTFDAWFMTEIREGHALAPLGVVLATFLLLGLARRRD